MKNFCPLSHLEHKDKNTTPSQRKQHSVETRIIYLLVVVRRQCIAVSLPATNALNTNQTVNLQALYQPDYQQFILGFWECTFEGV